MKVKYMIIAFGILPLVFLLTITSYFAAFAITVMTGGVNVLETDTALVNQGIFNIIRYTMIIIVCGWIYYRSFIKDFSSSDTKKKASEKTSKKIKDISEKSIESDKQNSLIDIFKHVIRPVNLLMIVTIGACIQFATDAVLYILGTLLPEQFTSYSAMIKEYKGNSSILFIATTILLAPFAEELIFRGLILKFARKALEKENKKAQMIAIIIQAVLFALYHGNLIQICYALIFGIMFGIIAVKFNSLLPSTLTHMVVNGTLYIIPDDIFESIPYACAVFAVAFALLIFTYVMFLKSHTKLSSIESHLD